MKKVKLIFILFLLFLSANIASAACTVSTTPVSFGPYDVFSPSPADSTGTITFTCDANTNVTTSIGQSPNSGGFNPRKMKLAGGTDLLNYNLYTDATYTSIWGDGTSGTATVTKRARRNEPMTLIVYGRIFPGQDVLAGSYSETLTVTITW